MRESDIGLRSEKVGYYGSGLRSAPRRARLGAAYRARKHANMIGMLVVFAAAIAAIAAAAFATSPMLSARTEGVLPPVASFAMYTNKLVVTVDASASVDPDGTIDSYSWNFGDGATGTGVNTTHTYATWGTWWITLTVTDNDLMTGTLSQQVTVSNPSSPPPTPYNVLGYVYATDGITVLLNTPVVITDMRTGAIWLTSTDAEFGYYQVDLNTNESGWTMGDTILIEAISGTDYGWASGVTGATGNEAYLLLNIVMTTTVPEFPVVLVPVLGIVGIAAVLSIKRRRDEL